MFVLGIAYFAHHGGDGSKIADHEVFEGEPRVNSSNQFPNGDSPCGDELATELNDYMIIIPYFDMFSSHQLESKLYRCSMAAHLEKICLV